MFIHIIIILYIIGLFCISVKIGVYYLIYYTFLAGFFMACLMIFYKTLDMKQPRWQNSNGIIGDNPGTVVHFIFIIVLYLEVLVI